MEEEVSYPDQAKELIKNYYNAYIADAAIDNKRFVDGDQVYVVWFAKTLQNWKALVATTNEDGLYFEVTYDGNKEQAYIDRYEKTLNFVVPKKL